MIIFVIKHSYDEADEAHKELGKWQTGCLVSCIFNIWRNKTRAQNGIDMLLFSVYKLAIVQIVPQIVKLCTIIA